MVLTDTRPVTCSVSICVMRSVFPHPSPASIAPLADTFICEFARFADCTHRGTNSAIQTPAGAARAQLVFRAKGLYLGIVFPTLVPAAIDSKGDLRQ